MIVKMYGVLAILALSTASPARAQTDKPVSPGAAQEVVSLSSARVLLAITGRVIGAPNGQFAKPFIDQMCAATQSAHPSFSLPADDIKRRYLDALRGYQELERNRAPNGLNLPTPMRDVPSHIRDEMRRRNLER